MKPLSIHYSQLQSWAEECGASLVGVLSELEAGQALARQKPNLEVWQQSGFAGEMSYMDRDATWLSEPQKLLPGLRSIVCLSFPYASQRKFESRESYARVARYAWGRDYHRRLKKRCRQFAESLLAAFPGESFHYRVFSDAVPLMERVLASASGIGFVGKNSLVLRPKAGSYFFLAEVLLSSPLLVEDLPTAAMDQSLRTRAGVGCGSCQRCRDFCPTGAIVTDGVLDSRRCISYLTIEKKTVLSAEESAFLGDWVFGCDVCQEVCPFNHRVSVEPLEDFLENAGVGPYLEIAELLDLKTREAFVARFQGTSLMRAGREGLVRNAVCVAVNSGQGSLLEQLLVLAREDTSELLRSQLRLSLPQMLPALTGRHRRLLKRFIDDLPESALE